MRGFCLWSAVGGFWWHGFGPLVPLERRATALEYKVVLIDDLHPMMKRFYPDGKGLCQNKSTSTHRTGMVTGWLDENEIDVNHMLWSSQPPDLKLVDYQWGVLD